MTVQRNDDVELFDLEKKLLRVDVRSDRAALERLLAPDFVEFGSSGRVYARSEIIDALLADPNLSERLAIENATKRAFSDNVALLTYAAIGERTGRRVNRSSLWIRDGGGWRMTFHQGTVATAEPVRS